MQVIYFVLGKMCFRGCKPGLYVPCMPGDTRLPRPVHVRYIPPREANAEFMHAEHMSVLYDPRMFCNSVQDKIL